MSINNTLYMIGGTGNLGSLVAKGLVTAVGFESRKALVRDLDKAKPLADMGWSLVQVSDMKDSSEMEKALVGAKAVVSTVSGGDMVQIEQNAIAAAKKAGASVYVPSQFGVDYRRWGTSFPFLAGKKQILDYADEQGMPTLKVFTGFFSDWIFDFLADPTNAKARIVGDGSAKVSFTHREDIGYVLAKALADPEYATGGFLSMQGDTVPYKDAIALLEKTTGKKFEIDYIDPEVALKEEQELLGKGFQGDMGAFFGSFALHLLGEPARGNTGGDVSAEAKTFDVKLRNLETTLTSVYGS